MVKDRIVWAILMFIAGFLTMTLFLTLVLPHVKVVGLINTRSSATMEASPTPDTNAQPVSEPVVTNSPSEPQTDAVTGAPVSAQDEPQPSPTPTATPDPAVEGSPHAGGAGYYAPGSPTPPPGGTSVTTGP